jgi:uncharacterized protein (DUF4415 family)
MAANKSASRRTAMLAAGKINKGGRPVSANPRKLITIRLPTDVMAR